MPIRAVVEESTQKEYKVQESNQIYGALADLVCKNNVLVVRLEHED